MAQKLFSEKRGLIAEKGEPEITIRDDAPESVRAAILSIAHGQLGLSPTTLRHQLCTVLSTLPDRDNWSEYPNIWDECQELMEEAPWYNVYDFIEQVYADLIQHDPGKAAHWEARINRCFVEKGVGWRLVRGGLESRGPEGFRASVDKSRETLKEVGLSTAHNEIDEAIKDLSRRPEPDLTGAIHHAMAALECTARQCVEKPKATLGEILKKYPGLVPKPIDEALSCTWGYASEMARHVREGRRPEHAETELVVSMAASCCIYLAAKLSKKE